MVYRPDAADTITGIRTALYEQHDEWQGTPYRIGGLSKRGIDCSGFVFTTLQSRFGIEVPRTARAQSRLGEAVALEEMQPGDLVFFRNNRSRTGWHVGIYVENRQFLHASTSQGVILSSLEEPYWRSTFQQARRLPFDY